MSKHIAFLSAAALLGAVMPAAAADYYDGGDRPLAFHSRDDVYIDGGRARVEHRQDVGPQDLGPAPGYRRAPGPVVFDERGPDRRFDRPDYGYGAPVYRRPVAVARPAYGYGGDRPVAFVPPGGRPYGAEAAYGYGDGYRPAPLYRPAAVPVGPGSRRRLRRPRRRLHDRAGAVDDAARLAQDRHAPDLLPALTPRSVGDGRAEIAFPSRRHGRERDRRRVEPFAVPRRISLTAGSRTPRRSSALRARGRGPTRR